MPPRNGQTHGFKRTSSLLQTQIRKTSETRGFAQSRLLTHWAEIAGEDIAAISRPVDVRYGRGGFGATLTLLTTGANAPILEMQKEKLREKVNAVYGYNAISKVRITQTAATGFSEGQVSFDHRSKSARDDTPAPILPEAQTLADGVQDDGLRAALERLATNVYSKTQNRT
ncbi:DciA family protein [Marivita sp. XM-24bin2]|mgnify:FL=1|jgi:hypothetical protein|uniref:DUF721 domain-containing protein n=1 Tax=unclassified Marivita TaxID=2632480 RepID=UPI000D7B7044|nr:DciA family protein [Marivita sp. XM-24bin2]MCR9109539.1 DciA family protein [Paracoccaceae bacterium]PWL35329.1 MAG: DUF721 domain-containing protein [Marivita sp. XM-24bin2]